MVGGRKPVPSTLAELHGHPGGLRAKAKTVPKPVGNLEDAPPWMSDNQQAAWSYALSHSPPGLLKRIDRGVLAVFIIAEDLHRQAVLKQNELGLLVRAPRADMAIQSPYLPVINRQGLIMIKAASELGFTPVCRPRIYAAGPAPGEGLHGNTTSSGASLAQFLDSDPDAPTLN